MSVYALAEFPLEGYQHFRRAFLVDPGTVTTGCEGARVFSADDGRVVVLTTWADAEALDHFRAELRRDRADGAVMAPAVVSELTHTEDLLDQQAAVAASPAPAG